MGRAKKPVDMFDLTGRYIRTASSVREAAQIARVLQPRMSAVLHGRGKRVKHYLVQFHEENSDVS